MEVLAELQKLRNILVRISDINVEGVREVDDPLLGSVLHAGVVPHVAETPGAVRWTGPAIGQHNEEVLGGLLHLGVDDIAALRQEGVI